MKKVRASLRIKGRVQGVFYRQSAADEARRLGLVGYVRNLPDGDVDAIAEGKPEKVDEFIAWCRHGPPAARVDELKVDKTEPVGDFRDFAVERYR